MKTPSQINFIKCTAHGKSIISCINPLRLYIEHGLYLMENNCLDEKRYFSNKTYFNTLRILPEGMYFF